MSVKYFDTNNIDIDTTWTLTSANSALVNYVYDNQTNTRLISSGSNDATTEVWVATFAGSVTFDRIFINDHNIKAGDLKYSDDNQATWTDFSSAIAWSGNTVSSNYYEFTEVSGVTDIRLTMNTTQTANVEKYVNELRCFSELGEVATNPAQVDPEFDEDSRLHRLSGGGNVYVFFGEKLSVNLLFTDAGTSDMTLFRTIKNRGKPFYVYLGGGDTTILQEPFRISDMYLVNYVNKFAPKPKQGFLLGAGTVISQHLLEV